MREEGYGIPPPSAAVAEGLHRAAFACAAAVVLASPWCFGAWERWWFWPFAALLSLAALFSGAATLLEGALLEGEDSPVRRRRIPRRAFAAMGLAAPFLLYAAVRACFPSGPGSPLVAMECERSLLLFFTPAVLGVVLLLSSRRRGRAVVLRLLLADAALLAVYGLANHFATNDEMRLWVDAKEWNMDYGGRLSSTFFCPNHFSAWLNAVLCVLAGAALVPGAKRRTRLLCLALGVLLLAADFLSLSRGGLASLFLGWLLVVPAVGLRGRRPAVRLAFAGAVVAVFAAAGALVLFTDNPLMDRLSHHSVWQLVEPAGAQRVPVAAPAEGFAEAFGFREKAGPGGPADIRREGANWRFPGLPKELSFKFSVRADREGVRLVYRSRKLLAGTPSRKETAALQALCRLPASDPAKQRWDAAVRALRDAPWRAFLTPEERRARRHDAFWYGFDRGQYIGSALRAWRSNPVWGIGPGQHSNRWAEFEPTDPGVRPTPENPLAVRPPKFRDYAKHLYEVHSDWTQLLEEYGVVGFALFLFAFVGFVALFAARQGPVAASSAPDFERGLPLAALLLSAVFAVHSTFDFSLQMPSIVWLVAWIAVSALLQPSRDRSATPDPAA